MAKTRLVSDDISNRIENSAEGIFINGKNGWYQIANFGLKLLYRIVDPNDEVSWHASIITPGKEEFVELSHDDLASPPKFHTALLKKGYVFKGATYEMNILKEQIIEDAKPANAVWTLGQHSSGGFVFANGVWYGKTLLKPDDFNIVKVKDDTLFLPFAGNLHMKKYKNAARIVHVPSDVTVQHWMTLFFDTYGNEGLLPFCFFLASLFRDVAFKKVHFFPLLYLRGQKGSGKSSVARSLTALLGFPQPEFNLKSPNTAKSLPRTLDQVSNAVVWFDEYSNDMPSDIRALLQAVYDGGGYQKSLYSSDNSTTSVDIQSAVVLTSNYLPENDIFLSRCVVETMNATVKTDTQKKSYDALMSTEAQGLSSITTALLGARSIIVKEWSDTYQATFNYLRQHTTDNIEQRVLANTAVILTPAVILERHGKICLKAVLGKELNLEEEARKICLTQQALLTGKSELNIFFEILTGGIEAGDLQPRVDFVISKRKQHNYIALKLQRLVSYYMKQHRMLYNKLGLPKSEILTMLQQHPAYKMEKSVHFKNPKTYKDSPGNAVILDYDTCQQCFGLDW